MRWARDVAFPKLVELVELNKYAEGMDLAEQIQQVLPDDPKLKKLLPEMSRLYRVETVPPGAHRRGEAVRRSRRRVAFAGDDARSPPSGSPSGSTSGASPCPGTRR